MFILIRLFVTLTRTVISQPLWAFGFAGGLILIVIIHYAKEYINLFGTTGI
jgi:hypothetical protein